ncbi:hypothetical protein GIS00_05740 [Nakamurella sp. YIM 132087]|uniref:CoA transferase subunit A n=1 Tax=Nakamurella alba TaxID=2665158 RepID=A0A7K1FHA4_9ACTN|nr:CoA-transferase [Nakamurella alba]MTD13446.1 hypothetical protein [Nakamurella alba]
MPSKVVPLQEVVSTVPDGCVIGMGGVLNNRRPIVLLDAIGQAGRRNLSLWSMLGGLDVEILAVHDALAEVGSIYVGFEGLGPAPAFERAVADGRITARDHSELTLIGGLRAAQAGLPFWPTRGATGSDIARELGLREVADPYTGECLLAAPAIRPDLTLLHAEAATTDGTVLLPAVHDFLTDHDATIARAATRTVVGVERIAGPDEARDRGVLLHGFEVDAVVVLPGGARPTGLPGVYDPDLAAISAYLAAAQHPDTTRSALDELLAGARR